MDVSIICICIALYLKNETKSVNSLGLWILYWACCLTSSVGIFNTTYRANLIGYHSMFYWSFECPLPHRNNYSSGILMMSSDMCNTMAGRISTLLFFFLLFPFFSLLPLATSQLLNSYHQILVRSITCAFIDMSGSSAPKDSVHK